MKRFDEDFEHGPLKLRPIVSNHNSASEKLAKLLVKILREILHHIPAHLDSRDDFQSRIPKRLENHQYFGSLDVRNLYGSIPLNDQYNVPSVFSSVTRFFATHHQETQFEGMIADDFNSLLILCLTSDSIYFKKNSQTNMWHTYGQ